MLASGILAVIALPERWCNACLMLSLHTYYAFMLSIRLCAYMSVLQYLNILSVTLGAHDRLCGLSNAPFHGHVAMRRGCWLGRSLVTFAHVTQNYIECICTYSISACSNISDIVVCAYHGICGLSNTLSNIHVIVLQGHRPGHSQTAFIHATQDNDCRSSTIKRCLV